VTVLLPFGVKKAVTRRYYFRYIALQTEMPHAIVASGIGDVCLAESTMHKRDLGISPMRWKQRGFTMLELCIVLAITLVVSAVAMPSILGTMRSIRLRSSVETVAGILQQARMRAVRDNHFYTVVAAAIGNGQEVCVDLNYNGQCGTNEPLGQLGANVALATAATPSTLVLTCGATGPNPCPAGYNGLSYIPQPATVAPSYNARGLPCVGNPTNAQPIWPAVLCTQTVPPGNPGAGNPVGFLYVFQYTGSANNSFGALTVTPSGLVTVWMYSGQDANGNDYWSQ